VQLPQSVDAHPLQADAAAEELSVIPALLLLKKVEADISLLTFLLWHAGQSGTSLLLRTRYSNSLLHFSHWYS